MSLDQHHLLDVSTGFILLAILSLIWIVIGVILGRKAKDMEGFMLAGRNVGLSLGAATIMATWVTSNTTMLAPQFGLELGVWGLFAYTTASFGLFLFAPVASRIHALMPKGYTSGDFIRLRYGKATWILFLLISVFHGLTWLVSMGMAGGILMYAIAGIPYLVGMSVILFVCVGYTLFGGLYAVIGTDFIQSVIIMIGITVVAISVLGQVNFEESYQYLSETRPMLISVFMPAALIAVFNSLFFSVGEVFHSNVWWSRAFAMRKGVGKKACILAGCMWLPIPIVAGFIGLMTPALGLAIESPDMTGPMVAAHILGKTGAIVVFIVFFCSLASSIDSLLASLSDVILEDIWGNLFGGNLEEKSKRRASTFIICSLGVFTWLVCAPRIGTLASVLFFAGPLVASTIWPIITGLYWKKANSGGAFWGMLSGSIAGLVSYYQIGWYSGALVGGAVSMLTVIIFTYAKSASFEWEHLNEVKS